MLPKTANFSMYEAFIRACVRRCSRSGTCSVNHGAIRAVKFSVTRRFSRIESGERVLKFTPPPSESTGLSGVWPFTTSRDSNIAPVKAVIRVLRFCALKEDIPPPSMVMELIPAPIPRTLMTSTTSSPGLPKATPGRRIASSVAFILGRSTRASIDATFLRLSALRCWVSAEDRPAFSEVTLKVSSISTVLVSSKSRTAVWPAPRVRVARWESRPV